MTRTWRVRGWYKCKTGIIINVHKVQSYSVYFSNWSLTYCRSIFMTSRLTVGGMLAKVGRVRHDVRAVILMCVYLVRGRTTPLRPPERIVCPLTVRVLGPSASVRTAISSRNKAGTPFARWRISSTQPCSESLDDRRRSILGLEGRQRLQLGRGETRAYLSHSPLSIIRR